MNTPAWLDVELGPACLVDGEEYVVTVRARIRRWHPGYWWARLRHAITGRAL